jgi:hypothetical protein
MYYTKKQVQNQSVKPKYNKVSDINQYNIYISKSNNMHFRLFVSAYGTKKWVQNQSANLK